MIWAFLGGGFPSFKMGEEKHLKEFGFLFWTQQNSTLLIRKVLSILSSFFDLPKFEKPLDESAKDAKNNLISLLINWVIE